MKPKYKCTYTSEEGAACPIMWKYKKPHPSHCCHEYNTTNIQCKFCVELNPDEVPRDKIWCDDMPECDSYNDGGIGQCEKCNVIQRKVVFKSPKPKLSLTKPGRCPCENYDVCQECDYKEKPIYIRPEIDESKYPKSRVHMVDLKPDISKFTKEELVEALCNQKGVKSLNLVDNGCVMSIGQDWKVKGNATIIVVKE